MKNVFWKFHIEKGYNEIKIFNRKSTLTSRCCLNIKLGLLTKEVPIIGWQRKNQSLADKGSTNHWLTKEEPIIGRQRKYQSLADKGRTNHWLTKEEPIIGWQRKYQSLADKGRTNHWQTKEVPIIGWQRKNQSLVDKGRTNHWLTKEVQIIGWERKNQLLAVPYEKRCSQNIISKNTIIKYLIKKVQLQWIRQKAVVQH